MSTTQQADGEIHEDQLLNFLVNSLDEEVALTLAENAELDAEDIYEVLVGACADGTSVSTLCERSKDAPHKNSVLYHLHTKFDLETLEQVGNMLLQKDVLNVLPKQVKVVSDLQLRPYYGDEDDTDGLYHSETKRGTTAFHAYATLYARVKNKRYTLAVRRLEDGAPPAVSSQSFSVSSTALTSRSRPSILIANSTTASVSRCFTCTTKPTSCQSSVRARRSSRNSRKAGVE